jgi:hypothetical protein
MSYALRPTPFALRPTPFALRHRPCALRQSLLRPCASILIPKPSTLFALLVRDKQDTGASHKTQEHRTLNAHRIACVCDKDQTGNGFGFRF